jgi:hypothetical protein
MLAGLYRAWIKTVFVADPSETITPWLFAFVWDTIFVVGLLIRTYNSLSA